MTILRSILRGLHQEWNTTAHTVDRHRRREVKLIVPTSHCTDEIKHEIFRAYDGATMLAGRGAWVDGWGDLVEEDVTIFFIATDRSNEHLIELAKRVRDEAGEKCLYLKLRDGEVVYVF